MLGFSGILYCDRCKRSIADLGEDEIRDYGSEVGVIELCFDCDPDSAATVPSLFWQWMEGDVFVLDGECFLVQTFLSKGQKADRVTHTHEQLRARSCLSSSTYLHKASPNQSHETQNTVTDAKFCERCGSGDLLTLVEGMQCEDCGLWSPFEEFVLPTWLVRDAMNETIADNLECLECRTTQYLTSGRISYCPYHHALLVEQFEDGSLGWSNETP
jgi:hypothetical protein